MSKPKAEVVLPPKPQREEITPPTNLKDLANIINYYEHLVQEWEQWGESVESIINGEHDRKVE